MIRLEMEADKNSFCFFLKDRGRLCCFRYTTIIFSFAISPFILNWILRYHAAPHSPDPCRHMMENHFYVDNLVMTGDRSDELFNLYTLSRKRLRQGEGSSCSLATLFRDPGQNGGGWYPEQSWNWLWEGAGISVQSFL